MARSTSRAQGFARCVLGFAFYALTGSLQAAPFVPTDDAQALERLPERNSSQYQE